MYKVVVVYAGGSVFEDMAIGEAGVVEFVYNLEMDEVIELRFVKA